MWIDSHNHLHDIRLGNTAYIVEQMQAAGITGCMVNATCPSDWQKVLTLREAYPHFIQCSLGVHPWHVAGLHPSWSRELSQILADDPNLSIGECGLDLWVQNSNLKLQLEVFKKQLEIAHTMDRPVTIHCLKAWQHLLDCFASCGAPRRFLMHSFAGSREMAKCLLKQGAYFSFSGYFLHPRKAKVLEVFQSIPLENILLETDAPDMIPVPSAISHMLENGANHPANLAAIGTAFARQIACDPQHLARVTAANHFTLFGAFAES